MKNSYLFKQPNHLTPRTAIAREQKQFIQIAFAVHLSAAISAERYRSPEKRGVDTCLLLYCIDGTQIPAVRRSKLLTHL